MDNVPAPEENLIGVHDEGWHELTTLLNNERASSTSLCLETGRYVLNRAVEYSKSRHVFGRLIGQNQGIHFPLADSAFEGYFDGEIPWMQITHGLRNYIERWYRTFKERTKRFYNNFPIKDPNEAVERISRFLHLYAYWYNHMRPHERFHNATPFSLS